MTCFHTERLLHLTCWWRENAMKLTAVMTCVKIHDRRKTIGSFGVCRWFCQTALSFCQLPAPHAAGGGWWKRLRAAVMKVISASAQKWRLSAHEFTDTVHRLGSLPVENTIKLVKKVDQALATRDSDKVTPGHEAFKDSEGDEQVGRLPTASSEDGGDEGVDVVPTGSLPLQD
ncbi:unnamed protein product, partial [Durusdinium trenchii]